MLARKFHRGPGAFHLPSYRLYRLDGAGNIYTADWLAAGDDEDAVRQARELNLPYPSELWDRHRMVARIDPSEHC